MARPPKYDDPEDLKTNIDEYFKYCDKNNKPYTILGMAVYLDIHRDTLHDYGRKEKFSDIIKSARQKVELYAEEKLFTEKNVTGIIFNLKNNFNWVDKREVDNNHKGSIDHNIKSKMQAYFVKDAE